MYYILYLAVICFSHTHDTASHPLSVPSVATIAQCESSKCFSDAWIAPHLY